MSLNVIQGFLRCLTARLVKAIRQDLEGSYGDRPIFQQLWFYQVAAKAGTCAGGLAFSL
ncbi:hypothetical protein NP603_11100 [Methylomonas sp. SURF-1]|uniref:Uncharacterized protein n=1 Tax=Methylomonas aurea TaxID=2952224 RepID=A0ABT1UHF0_9GAMM|nr:hypothetical protein [Methylomonas sp. SURF-1]MCQ8181657.1 hypothetical protein [Methylomonas sp. SURF-1]